MVFAQDHVKSGLDKYEAGYFEGAIGEFTKAIKLDPLNAEAYYGRARSYYELKDYLSAINDYDKAIKLNPKHAKAYYNRGYLKFTMQNYRGAIDDFNKTIELNPNSALAFAYRGDARNELGDLEGACNDWTAAYKLNYTDVMDRININCSDRDMDTHQYLDKLIMEGDLKFNNGDTDGAIKAYNKALEIDPEYDKAYFSRGIIKLVAGNKQGACEDWKTAQKLGNIEATQMIKQHCIN